MVKKKYSLLEDGVELIVCSPYVYKSLDKKELGNLRKNDHVIIGTWTTKDYPSGEFLTTLSEDFSIIYNHIKRIEEIKSITDFDGIFQIRKITIYTSLIYPQDALELFFIQKKMMDIALTHQQAFAEFDERICRNGHCMETEFFLHIFHFLFDRLNREFNDLDCVPHDTMHELISDRYDLEGDSIFWNAIEGTHISSYTRNIDAKENFIEKVRGEILKPEHFIVATNTANRDRVLLLVQNGLTFDENIRAVRVIYNKHKFKQHFKKTEGDFSKWAVINNKALGEDGAITLEFTESYNDINRKEVVKGQDIIIVDGIVDTGNTLINAVNFLHENGAKSIIACITHGVLTGNAVEKIANCEYLDKLYISNSLPQKQAVLDCAKIEIIDIINSQISEGMARL
jgi:hypothetical protein